MVVRIDTTPPTITGAVSPGSNALGCHRTDMIVSFETADALSGVDKRERSVVVSTEGAGQYVTRTVSDLTGNTMMDCARGAAAAIGGEVEYQRHANLYDEVVPNATINRLFLGALRDVGVPEQEIAETPKGPFTHSADTGIISKNIPTISGRIIVGPPGLVLHTKEATIATRSPAAHRGLVIGAKTMALTAWRLANSLALLEQARRDLVAAMGTGGAPANGRN